MNDITPNRRPPGSEPGERTLAGREPGGSPAAGSPPRVCHLSTRLVKGGADFNIFYNLLHSAPRFAQTLVIGGEYDQGLVARLRAVGVDVVVIPAIQREIHPRQELTAYLALRRFFRTHPFEIIYTHNAKTGILGRFAAPRQRRAAARGGSLLRRIGAHLLRRPSDGCLCTVGVDPPPPGAADPATASGTAPGTAPASGTATASGTAAGARPVIVHGLHGMSFTETGSRASFYLFRALERAAARRTDHFVSVGYTIRDLMLAARVGKPPQYRIIRSGMDIDRFRAAATDATRRAATRRDLGCTVASAATRPGAQETVLFVVVARIERRKGQHHFLQAFARALKSQPANSPAEIRAAIVGEGAERTACETLARELGISDRVVFTGFRDNPQDYLAAADVVCLSSEWEGVPQSLVQAAAVGRAAVAFDVPGIREILSDGRTGCVVPYPDIDAFATAIQHIAADPAMRAEYGAAAASINLDEFRLATMVSQTEALYRELVPLTE